MLCEAVRFLATSLISRCSHISPTTSLVILERLVHPLLSVTMAYPLPKISPSDSNLVISLVFLWNQVLWPIISLNGTHRQAVITSEVLTKRESVYRLIFLSSPDSGTSW